MTVGAQVPLRIRAILCLVLSCNVNLFVESWCFKAPSSVGLQRNDVPPTTSVGTAPPQKSGAPRGNDRPMMPWLKINSGENDSALRNRKWNGKNMIKDMNRLLATALLLFAWGTAIPASPAIASPTVASDDSGIVDQIKSKLKPPTEDQPQIMIPSSIGSGQSKEGQSAVEALIYLYEHNGQKIAPPQPSDTLIFTLHRDPNDGRSTNEWSKDPKLPILAGAKVPMSRARFPTNIKFTKANLVPSPNDSDPKRWETATKQDDILLVRAIVCPESDTKTPCEVDEAAYIGYGVSKLTRNLPGSETKINMRLSASVQLQSTNINDSRIDSAGVAAGEELVKSIDEF